MRGLLAKWLITLTIFFGVPAAFVWAFMPLLDISHATYLTAQGDYVMALQALDRAIAFNGNIGSAYDRRGFLYFKLNQYDKALADLNRALALNDGDWQAYNNRAWVYAHMPGGDLTRALSEANHAVSLCTDCASAYDTRGYIELKMGDLDKARIDLTRAIELNTRLADAYSHRAQCYDALNQPDLAASDRKQAKRLGYFGEDPSSPTGSGST